MRHYLIHIALTVLLAVSAACSDSPSGPEDGPDHSPVPNAFQGTITHSNGSEEYLDIGQMLVQFVPEGEGGGCLNGFPCLSMQYSTGQDTLVLITSELPSTEPGDWTLPLELTFNNRHGKYVYLQHSDIAAGEDYMNVPGANCRETTGVFRVEEVVGEQLRGTVEKAVANQVASSGCDGDRIELNGTWAATPNPEDA